RSSGIDGHRGGNIFQRDAVEQRLHVFQRINGHADFSDFAEGQSVVGVHADLGGEVEGDRESFHTLSQQIPVTLVRFRGAAEPGVLTGGPQAAAIHGGIYAAGKREFAGEAEIAFGVETRQVLRGYDRVQGQAGGRGRLLLRGCMRVIFHRTRRERRKEVKAKISIAAAYTSVKPSSHAVGRLCHSRQAATAPYTANMAKSAPVASWKNCRTARQITRSVTFMEFHSTE